MQHRMELEQHQVNYLGVRMVKENEDGAEKTEELTARKLEKAASRVR